MNDRDRLRPWAAGLCLMAIVGVFSVRCDSVARANSPTGDEPFYVVHSLHFWITGNDLDMWKSGVPRLPHLINTSLPYLMFRRAGLHPVASPEMSESITQLLYDERRVIVLVRRMAIGWGILLLFVVYRIVARLRGPGEALVAVALLSLVPEIIAHASIAGADMPGAAAMLLALLTLARYIERPSPPRWVTMALAIGLAWAVRHTAILLLPLAVGVSLWIALRQARPPGLLAMSKTLARALCSGGAVAVLAFMVLWAADGLRTIPLGSVENLSRGLRSIHNLGPFEVSRLPIPTSLLSLKAQLSHASYGHPAYFCGEFGHRGWPLYFPVAFLLKTPIGLLLLIVIASIRIRPRFSNDILLLLYLSLLCMALVRNKIDIGLRYALLTYPLIMPFIARLFDRSMLRDRIWGPITIAAAVLLLGSSVSCHPRYLSTFNVIGGGPKLGWLYLADSNIDWGQDLNALAGELKERGIDEITLMVSGDARAVASSGVRLLSVGQASQDSGVQNTTRPGRRIYQADGRFRIIPTRYIAVSVNTMLGLYGLPDLRWLWTRRLVGRVNDSIFIFDLDQPTGEPFIL